MEHDSHKYWAQWKNTKVTLYLSLMDEQWGNYSMISQQCVFVFLIEDHNPQPCQFIMKILLRQILAILNTTLHQVSYPCIVMFIYLYILFYIILNLI